MEELISQIEWLPTVVAAAAAFLLGWAWYSPKMFLNGWLKGIGEPVYKAPMWMPMVAQFFSLLLLSIITGMAAADGHVGHAVLVSLTVAGFVKAGGFYSGKTKYAVSVEVGYVVAATILIILVHLWL